MSFKRAGDDHCALRLQKKHRVTELFAEDIPADEVDQTRSGRFVCLVCPHNPVIDTMPMLSIHRQGKKHLTNMSRKIEKDHNLSELIQKRQHELHLQEADINNKPSSIGKNTTPSNAYTSDTATPLLARTKQLTESITRVGQTYRMIPKLNEKVNEIAGKRSSKNKPFFQSKVELRLSNVFEKDFKKSKNLTSSTEINSRNYKTGQQMNISEDKLSKSVCGFQNLNSESSSVVDGKDHRTDSQTNPLIKTSHIFHETNQINSPTSKESSGRVVGGQQSGKNDPTHSQQACDVTTREASSVKKVSKEQQKKYLDLRMSGWILCLDGKWTKDEDAEFDSDEGDEATLTK